MNRRRFIVGFGGAAISAGAVVGSQAFSTVNAERDITVSIEKDDNAFLTLDVVDGTIAEYEGGVLNLKFDADHPKDAAGSGVNPRSVYEFTGNGDRIFDIENHGNQTVGVYAETVEKDGPQIELFDGDDPDRDPLTETNKYELQPGDGWLKACVRIETGEKVELTEHTQTLRIMAVAYGTE